MDVIFPCAGLSSRFPGTRPKYLLTDYSGKLMVERSAMKVPGKKHIVILRDHVLMYDAENILRDCFGNSVNIIVLESPTNGPAETVYRALEKTEIAGPFLIKDCDSFFSFETQPGNVVYTSSLSKNPDLNKVAQLSYVISNDQGVVSTIIEKSIISDKFCVGGYQFASKFGYMSAFEAVNQASNGELYISSLIEYMMENDYIFIEKEVSDYVNVGTLDAWLKYNDKPTIFCDIDGVVVYNQSEYGNKSYERSQYVALKENVNRLFRMMNDGAKIVFVTARPDEHRAVTQRMLNDLGFSGCELIMGVHHSKRILINDYTHSNPYPSAIAVNVERDSDKLKDYI